MFFKIIVLKKFANFTGKHMCQSLFLIKLQAPSTANLLKTDSNTGFFFNRKSPLASSDSFRFTACNFIKKRDPGKDVYL